MTLRLSGPHAFPTVSRPAFAIEDDERTVALIFILPGESEAAALRRADAAREAMILIGAA